MRAKEAKISFFLDKENNRLKPNRLRWFHWTVILGSLVVTIAAWHISRHHFEEKANIQFNKQANHLMELVTERMYKYEDALWAGVALIQAQTYGTDYEEWKRFSNILNIQGRYQGINGIGLIDNVSREDRAAYIEKRRQEQPGFNIFPEHQNSILFPIRYIQPVEVNREAVGLDIAHEENRYAAAIESRDTGKPKITGPITLVQDAEKSPGFLFYAPFYVKEDLKTPKERRKNFSGLVYAPFIVKNLMKGTLEEERRLIGVTITDQGTVLYDENNASDPEYDLNPYKKKTVTKKTFGREWVFEFQTKKTFRNVIESQQPQIILIGGLIIDFLLVFLFFTMASANRQAQKFGIKVRNQLEDAMNFQNLMLNAIPHLIFVKDSQYRIVECNDAFLNVYPKEQQDKVIGFTTVENYPDDEAAEFLSNDKKTLEEGYNEAIETISFPNGEIRILSTKKIRFYSAGKPYILGISNDITEIKQAEDEILRSNLELERFAYITSHDLQEPLRMVSNFTTLLNEEYKDQLDDEAKTYMSFIIEHAGRMRELISDLLEYSRMGQEEVGAEWIDTNHCLDIVKENLQTSIEETKTQITHDELPKIFMTQMQFIRLLQNLISNAIKYRNKKQPPKIHIGYTEGDAYWSFSVSDNGIGIKEEYLEQIFVLFRRLQSKSEYSGTGIGLAICFKIVESMKGKIYAKSTYGQGTVIHFDIPKSKDKISGGYKHDD